MMQVPPPPPGFEIVGQGGPPPPPPGFQMQPPMQRQTQQRPVQQAQDDPFAQSAPYSGNPNDLNPILPGSGVITNNSLVEPGANEATAIDLANLNGAIPKKGMWVRQGDEVWQLPGDAYQGAIPGSAERVTNGVYVDRPNFGRTAEAFATAAGEQIPFMDEAVAAVGGALSGRGYDATRQQQMLNRDLLNQTNGTARDIGGVVGAIAPAALLPGASFIRGAQGLGAVGRAGAVGAGYGGLYGAGNTDGGLQERATGAGIGALAGFATGGAFQGVANGLSGAGARAASNLSPQRQLSNAGVQLTPGQMTGGFGQTIEDAIAGTLPVFGDSINAAKRRGLESFDNVATNIALEPIGARIPNTAGREGVRQADDAISRAYDAALSNVSVTPDQPFMQAVLSAADPQGLTPEISRNLTAVVNNILDPLQQGPVTGQAWKEVDSQLAAAIRAADRASSSAPEQRILRDRLTQTREALGGLLERTDPFAYRDVRAADRASATYRIVREATADAASAGREGNTSPAALNRAVRSSAGSRQFARGEGLLQDLTDSAMQVLPNTVPNSGTAARGIVGGGLATGAAFNPQVAIPAAVGLFGGAAAYSRPVQGALNAAYRAHSPGSGRQALGGLFGRTAPGSAALEQGILQWLLNRPRDDQALVRGR